MKLLIVSTKQRLADYSEFVQTMNSMGAEAICVHDLKYCFLGETKPLHVIPIPKLLKIIKKFNPDFVITDTPFYIPHMVKLLDRHLLFHLRGAELSWLTSQEGDNVMYPSLSARMYTHYLAQILVPGIKKADLVLPNSKWLQKEVEQHLPGLQTKTLYVGINPEKWLPNDGLSFNVKHPAVVSVFQFTIFRKVLGILRFSRVVKRMRDVNFYFAGDGPYLNLIKKNYPSNAFFVGKVAKSEVRGLLESGDVFVHPSGLDALPRSVKEASLMEKPIIASNVGGLPEIVKNNQTGFLCHINDTDQWVNKIRFFLDNSDIARKFGKNAREYVKETFDWRKIAQDFLKDLYAFGQAVS